jgi:hypothetical protein
MRWTVELLLNSLIIQHNKSNMARKQAEVFNNSDIKNMYISDGVDYRTKEEKQYDEDGYYGTKAKAFFKKH